MAQLVRAPPCHGGGRGFESRLGRSGSLAQLGEHLPYKQRVTGSSPVTSTCISFWCRNAGVAELADAQDLKSCCSDTVPVRFRSPAFIERALDKSVIIDVKKLIEYVCVAQLDRALGYGPRCREFESSRARIERHSRKRMPFSLCKEQRGCCKIGPGTWRVRFCDSPFWFYFSVAFCLR